MASCWQDCDTSSSRTLRLTCDAIPLLEALKSRGIKIAMCTADTRIGAEGAVNKLGIAHYFDMIVAGKLLLLLSLLLLLLLLLL